MINEETLRERIKKSLEDVVFSGGILEPMLKILEEPSSQGNNELTESDIRELVAFFRTASGTYALLQYYGDNLPEGTPALGPNGVLKKGLDQYEEVIVKTLYRALRKEIGNEDF
jgi:hypothetical protein